MSPLQGAMRETVTAAMYSAKGQVPGKDSGAQQLMSSLCALREERMMTQRYKKCLVKSGESERRR